ncbi:MAG TPA: acyl-CoA dehydrogenase family protein [Spirochaetota bacterium]|jgi:acyl-CoA dehydrogenase|nr:acyl-CoA dehydrogenase family protein [Spirochaetota bacterium]OPZ39362.1 MAG: Acyl-CoA dehydrogenase [Spirochaetes bacterium ADurb.BinA120]HNU90890.1 acyl-CoA dehydrogenase family protein [Spirochaetota bacterium]HPI15029.1 acyl-CoA dehydrogenase family protein [Spirochaetota bacterium]HPO44174.1 acyl-CoA dehydrogenase family protein [Spirochaetota bacterium]
MERTLPISEEHVIFRESLRKFIAAEIIERYADWEQEGIIPREIWKKFGENGYLCPWASEEYAGSGADYLYSVIITEELSRAGVGSLFVPLHNDIVAPYIDSYGTAEQKARWLPGCVSGDIILAVAMTEPEAGSDLAAIKTTAVKKNGRWVLNGQKTFISNGILSDLVVVAARTGGADAPANQAISLFVVEREARGFSRGEPIKKIGLKAQDTAELFFDDCEIPGENLLGQEGMGFIYLMQKLQPERLICAVGAQAAAERCLEMTVEYAKERKLFGKPLSKFQNTQFVLAELAAEIAVGRSFVDDLIRAHMDGKSVMNETCMAKFWVTEMAKRVADRCLQIFGGYGYCTEYPISRFYLDARIQTIYAGTSEVMKLIIARFMGL